MKVIIVAGFLGSGKTTLILSTIERLNEVSGQKTGIIVNDFGKVNIDGKIMEKYGLDVKEVQGGCICCSLGSFLLDTVQRLAVNMHPDFIVIEPSGIAHPQQIVDTLDAYHGPPLEYIRSLVVMDVARFEKISKTMGVPFEKQVTSADAIVLNKIDEMNGTDIDSIEARLREIGFRGKIIRVSATERTNIDDVIEVMVNQ
jgi:G3E family GTPase